MTGEPNYSFERAQPVAGRNPHDAGYDPASCAELFCAVIGRAIKDLQMVEHLESKSSLSDYESKKLLGLTEDDHLADFLESDWFEHICSMLDIEPDKIRLGVRTRKAEAGPETGLDGVSG